MGHNPPLGFLSNELYSGGYVAESIMLIEDNLSENTYTVRYISPASYPEGGHYLDDEQSRLIKFEVEDITNDFVLEWVGRSTLEVVRPPVVLVHG